MSVLDSFSNIAKAIVFVGEKFNQRKKQFWDWYVKWRNRKREKAVTTSVDKCDTNAVMRIIEAIKAKRKKRRDSS